MSNNTDNIENDNIDNGMSPTDSPDSVGVRRVNNMPIFIGASVLGAFLVIVAMVASDRSSQAVDQEEPELANVGDTTILANSIAGAGPVSGYISAEIPAEIPAETKEEASFIQDGSGSLPPPEPPRYANLEPLTLPAPESAKTGLTEQEKQTLLQGKIQQFTSAVKAPTGVAFSLNGTSNGGSSRPLSANPTRSEMIAEIERTRREVAQNTIDPTQEYQKKMQMIQSKVNQAKGGAGGGSGRIIDISGGGDAQSGGGVSSVSFNTLASNKKNAGHKWSLDSNMVAPSNYEISAGFVIPATMITGINSDLPGRIKAQVSQSVYDTATGRHLLIPQGAQLDGVYDSDIAYGQRRLMVAWERIIFPDGRKLDIGSMNGSDPSGYSGFNDLVDNHFWRIFGSAFLMSGITATVAISQDRTSNNGDDDTISADDALTRALGQQMGTVAMEMVRKNMNIAPTLKIRPGYEFNVVVSKDITFNEPYKSFNY